MRIPRLTLTALVVVAAAGACGDDDTATADTLERYCELARTMAEPPSDINPATATADELTAAVKNHFSEHAADIDELEDVAPDEVADDIAVYASAARQIAQTGDISEFDTPENAPAIARQEAFDQRECGLEPPGG